MENQSDSNYILQRSVLPIAHKKRHCEERRFCAIIWQMAILAHR